MRKTAQKVKEKAKEKAKEKGKEKENATTTTIDHATSNALSTIL